MTIAPDPHVHRDHTGFICICFIYLLVSPEICAQKRQKLRQKIAKFAHEIAKICDMFYHHFIATIT